MSEHDGITDAAWSAVTYLATTIGARVAGSAAERAAAAYLVEEFGRRGVQAELWPFRYVGWEPEGAPHITVECGDGGTRSLATASMAFTDSTPVGGVRGRLEPAGVCELVPDLLVWPRYAIRSMPVAGEASGETRAYIAVVPEGQARPFPRPERQLLLEPIAIVGTDEFAPIAERVDRGETVMATVETHGRYVPGRESANVVAELPGDSPEVIIVSAHYDSVAGTPGAGDNASGVAGCLALASRFATVPRPRTLRFIAWGAHELGLLGSQAYAQELAQRGNLATIEAAVALDILSDGDRLGVWSGGERLRAEVDQLVPNLPTGFPIERFPRGRGETDSWSFAERGIDTIMLLTLPYSHFHLATDTPENNNRALFGYSVAVAQQLVAHLMVRPAVARPLANAKGASGVANS